MLKKKGKKNEKYYLSVFLKKIFLVNADQSSYLQPSEGRADINEPHQKIEF